MSVSKCYTIHCHKCAARVKGIEDQPLTPFRRAAQIMGWTTRVRYHKGFSVRDDYCPKCSKEQVK